VPINLFRYARRAALLPSPVLRNHRGTPTPTLERHQRRYWDHGC
jgi:hypothetical protein